MVGVEETKVELVDGSGSGNYGKFVVAPLGRGYGNTLGNSMRRVLLSGLPGVAPCAVKIARVTHEFSAISGIKEDVAEIILNVKNLIVRLENCDSKTVILDANGPGEITAGQIMVDSDVEILNPELLIATLDDGAKLRMEITLGRGIGYLPAEQNRTVTRGLGIGSIPIDSIFTPVVKANYVVENTRVGQVTDYDKLILEVWTNGVVSSAQAVVLAANGLIEHFGILADLPTEYIGCMNKPVDPPVSRFLENDLNIDELGLSVRSYNSLKRSGVNKLSDLMNLSRDDIAKVRNLGKKSYDEVIEKLASYGYNCVGEGSSEDVHDIADELDMEGDE
ncbi:MAG: DNA-directed RNA polymerase subunit alpha [Oscillospiraceae bacterium]|jgi:DNA-directed RNA polymerase subunit alpha|nr:DNA-directed RNA polymerase subunit alpha [Oscillospiraceae bacterium]